MKNKFTLRKMIAVAIIFISSLMPQFAEAQTPQYYNFNNGSSSNFFPFGVSGKDMQILIGPNELNQPSPAPGSNNITTIFWKSPATATTTFTTFSVKMGQTSATTLPTSAFITGLTTVYSASSVTLSTVAGGWGTLILQTPFLYNPSQSLVVEFSQCAASATSMSISNTLLTGFRRTYNASGSCVQTYSGQSADMMNFGVNLTPASPCTSPPTPGTSTATPSSGVCTGSNITLNLSGNSAGSGQTYQWQSSSSIGGPYSNLGGSLSSPGIVTPVTTTMYYRCEVTCAANSQTSTPVLVTINPAFPAGTYTINSAVATGGTNYQTFTAAAAAIACGIAGPVVFNVVAGSGPYNEQISIGQIGGASAVNTITINGNNCTLSFNATLSTAPSTLELNGTDYLTVNNLNITGIGATYAYPCHLWNQADNNAFNNCTFNCPANSSAITTHVPFSISGSQTSATTTGVAGNNNVITGCTMFSGYYNTAIVGNGSTGSTGNQVINCNIRDQYAYGMYIYYQNGAIIRGNTVERPTRTTLSTFYGIYVTTGCTNVKVDGNRIQNPFGAAPTNTNTAYGIYTPVVATAGNENIIKNNLVQSFNSSGPVYGIYEPSYGFNKYYHNTIAFDQTAATGTTTTYGIYAYGSTTDIRNNIVTIRRGGTGTKYGIYIGATAGVTCNYNDLYINAAAGTNYYGYNGTTSALTFAAWQGTGFDVNSKNVDPLYAAPGSNDYTPTNGLVNNFGTPVGVLTDIIGTSRSVSTPDMGAYEFTVSGLDAAISWVSPLSPSTAGLKTITVNIFNTQTTTITDLNLSYNDGTGPVTQAFSGLNLLGGTNQNLSFTTQYNLVSSVTMTVSILSVNGGSDGVAGNNTATYGLCVGLSGTYTINSAVATGGTNYQTFTAAVNALSCGIAGPVVFNVTAGSGPYTEQIAIPVVGGVSAVNTVIFNGNACTLTFAATLSTAPNTLELNGADYIRVNNLNIVGTGATYAMACHLWNSADNNIFTNCTFTVPANTISSTCVPFSLSGSQTSPTTSGVSGNNNLLTGCTMNSGYYNTVIYGNSVAPFNTGNQVVNCNIRDHYNYGLYNVYCQGTIFSGNTVERLNRTTHTTSYCIYMSTGSINCLAEKNRIRKLFDAAPANTSAAYCMYNGSSGTSGNENKWYNNLVSDISSAGAIYGMYCPLYNFVKIYHNTISFDHAASTSASSCYGMYAYGSPCDIRNNIITIKRGGTATKYGLYIPTPAGVTCNYNNIYLNAPAGTNYYGYNGTTSALTFVAWQATGFDLNSYSLDPFYFNPAGNNYKPTAALLDNNGALVGVSDDITGALRSPSTPDIGAYEFNVSPKDVGVFAIVGPNASGCYSNAETFIVTIKNYGTQVLNYATDPVTVNCDITGQITQTVTGTISSGTLAVGGTQNITLSPTVNGTANGNYTLNAYTQLATDGDNSNDGFPIITIPVGPVAGTVTSSIPSACNSGSPILTTAGVYGGAIQWQSSTTSASGPWTNVGTNSTTYSPGSITQTTYYQALTVCNSNTATSNAVTVTVSSPSLTGTTPGSRCGYGTVSLAATGSSGTIINWYVTASAGSPIGSGSPFTTPAINASTTFYAAASTGSGGTANAVMPAQSTTFAGNVRGYWFTSPASFTITSIDVPLAGTGQSIAVVKFTGNIPPPTYSTTTDAFTTLFLTQNNATTGAISCNIPVSTGDVIGVLGQVGAGASALTSYGPAVNPSFITIAGQSVGLTRMGMQFPLTTTVPQQLWQEVSTTVQIGRIEFTYSSGCESARTAVAATVTPAPLINVSTADDAVCSGSSTTVSVNSLNDPSYTYSWTSNPSGFSGSGAGPLTVSPTVTTKYIVTASDNTAGPNAGCATIDSVSVATGGILTAGSIAVNQNTYCASGTPSLTITGADGGSIRWQSSTVSASGPWTNVGTLNSTSYSPGTVTQTTYYRARVYCQSSELFTNVITVTINNPQLTGTTPASRCGAGTVTLGAAAGGGATINWYSGPSGGSPLATGTSYTTPVISSTTTYYVSASTGGGSAYAGLAAPPSYYNTSTGTASGIVFDVITACTIYSVDVYPAASSNGTPGTITIAIQNSSGTTIQSATVNVTGYVTPLTSSAKNTLTLNFNVPVGTNYRLLMTGYSGITGVQYDCGIGGACATNFFSGSYPTTIPGVLTQTNGYISGSLYNYEWMYFYNWQISSGCEGTRTAVTATVTPSTAINVSATYATPCAGNPTDISVSSANPNYTYTWTSNPSGFNQTGTGPFTVTPGVNTTYSVYAFDNSTSCGAAGSVNIAPTSNTISVSANATPNAFCPGGNAQLNASVATSTNLTYCTSALTSANYCNATSADLTNVTISGTSFNNNSVCNYTVANGDYTYYPPSSTTTAVLLPGQTYTVSVSCNSAAIVSLWIDFNQSGTFDATEWWQVYTSATTGSINITIPLTALTGGTGMRVRSRLSGNVNGSGDACLSMGSGSTDDYTVTIGNVSPANFTYAWSPSTYLTSSTISNPLAQNVMTAQSYVVVVTDQNSGCTKSATVPVTVNPPPQPIANSNAPVCEGFSLSLFGTNNDGTQVNTGWSWSGPSFSSGSQNPNISSASAANSGTYTLTITNSFGCTATSSTDVIVNPNPVLSIGTQTNVSCNGLSDGSVDLNATSGTFPYLFDLVGPSTPDGIFSGLAAGTYTATVNDDNGCAATQLTVTITEPPVLTVSAGSNTPVCSGTSLNLTSSPVGGTAGYSYAWTGPNGPVPTVQNPTIASATAADAGQYDVLITDAHGCTSTGSHTVQVNAAPTAAIALSGSPNKCLGQSATVSLTFTGTGPWNYTVSGSGGPYTGSTSSNPAIVNVTPIAAGVHTYTVTSVGNASCPTGGTASGSATVNVSTAPPPVSGPVPVGTAAEACVGTVMLLTSNVISGQNIIYSWNTGSNSSTVLFSTNIGGPFTAGPFQTTTNQVYAQFGALGGGLSGYQVCLQGVNGCGSSINKCLWLRGVVSGPGAIIPANGVVACPNDVTSYSCGASAGASLYSWTLSGSSTPITSGQGTTNVQVTFPAAFTSGQLCVTAALSCGGSSTSPARCMSISKNPTNNTAPVGVATACPGATGVSYSIPAVPGATGYNWTVPSNLTIATGANSPSITVNFPTPYNGSSSVCVTATSACGASASKCKTVVSGIPAQPAGITGPLTNVCGSTIQYSVVNPIASSYTWTNPVGTTISGSATGSTILLNVSPTFTSGFLTVAANSVACTPATSAPRSSSTIWGRPNNPGTITQNPPGAFCSGAFLNFSVVNPLTGPVPNYTWTSSNGAITSLQGPNNIDVLWGTNAIGTITVRAGNTCGLSAGISSQTFTPNNCREEGIAATATAFSVYPNPAHDKVTVSIDAKEQTGFNLKLRDMSGRVILSEDREAAAGINAYELDLKGFAKGIYMLEAQSANDKWKAKIIIE